MNRLYLDNAATTPLCEAARIAMADIEARKLRNPSSLHYEGRQAKLALDEAKEKFAESLGCLFGEVYFTSSGTEAVNLGIVGTALAHQGRRSRILVSASEHHAVLRTKGLLERLGFTLEEIRVDRTAQVDLEHLKSLMDEKVLLVSVMQANNELGTINPVAEVGDLAHAVGALFMSDGVQTFPSWFKKPEFVDLFAISAHKFYGPAGTGALYVRAGTPIKPLIVGGGQEREMRAGTEAVANIVGSAAALNLTRSDEFKTRKEQIVRERDNFLERVARHPLMQLTVDPAKVSMLPSHAHIRTQGIEAETMLIRLDRAGISASSGAACSSGSLEPSHVLLACGYSEKEAKEGLRFTFGQSNLPGDGLRAAETVLQIVDAIHASRA